MADKAIEVNDESEKLMSSLLDISDLALLRVFSFLNLRDSINFAETCVRLKKVGEMNFTKYKHLDLLKYEHLEYVLDRYYYRYAYYDDAVEEEDEDEEDVEEPELIDVEKVLSHIGKHIKTLSINYTVDQAVMDNCVNITSLKIYEIYDCSSEWKTWMNKLHLESLTIKDCDNFTEMSVPLATLKELKFTDGNGFLDSTDLINILEKTPELQSLQVELFYEDFKYDIFDKLPKLRCLDINIKSEDLAKLTEFLRFDVLTECKVCLPMFINDDGIGLDNGKGLNALNSFLEILAAKANLNKLGLHVSHVDENTFRILKLFHVASLVFYTIAFVDHCIFHDDCMIRELVNHQSNLKHLDFLKKYFTIDQAVFVLQNLVKLETFTFCMHLEDLDQLYESKIDEILKTSISRPMLTLYVNFQERDSVKITLWFDQRKHRIVRSDNGHKAGDYYYLTDNFTGQVCCS